MGWLTDGGPGLAGKRLAIAGALVLAFNAGAYFTAAAPARPTTAIIKPWAESRLVVKSSVQYVDKPVTKIKYLERIVRVLVELGNFKSLEELED